jgi:hypothetical protein
LLRHATTHLHPIPRNGAYILFISLITKLPNQLISISAHQRINELAHQHITKSAHQKRLLRHATTHAYSIPLRFAIPGALTSYTAVVSLSAFP